MKRLFSIVSILIGMFMITGLVAGALPAREIYASSTSEPRVVDPLGIDDLDDLLDIGDLDDILGLRIRGVAPFVDDEFALRDILLTRITRLLLLRSQLLGDLDADDILDFIDELERADTLRLLLVHRVLQLQFARLSLLGFERDDFRDLLLFRGLGIRQFFLFRDVELRDILRDLRFEFRRDVDIQIRRDVRVEVDVNVVKVQLGLGLRRFLLRRGLDIRDLEDLIKDRDRDFFPDRFREREERLRQRRLAERDELREERAREREDALRRRFEETEREREVREREAAQERELREREREFEERAPEREVAREREERPREREVIPREREERPREREVAREREERPREREVIPREREERPREREVIPREREERPRERDR